MENYDRVVNDLFGRTSRGTTSAIPRLIYNGKIMIPEADNPSALASLILEIID